MIVAYWHVSNPVAQIPWYMGSSLARLLLMTSMFLFFVSLSLPIDFTSMFSCKAIKTSISVDDILTNSFELSVNNANLLFSR